MNQFGICHLSTITVRAEASHRTELVTQLLFGETYQVIAQSEDEEWLHIQTDYDQYKGWIPAFQHYQVSEQYYTDYQLNKHSVLTQSIAELQHPSLGRHLLSAGSVLPFFRDGVIRLGEEELKIAQPTDKPSLEAFAKQYLLTPYLWGGRSIFGIDCSGFVQQVFRAIAGIDLPRDAYQQAEMGEPAYFSDLQSADLAFFSNSKGKIVHVGIMLATGEIIHASGKVKIDDLTSEGIISKETGKQTHELATLKRLIF